MNESQHHSLDELASLVDLPRRTIRFYIQTGLLPRPEGTGKGAYYTQTHLEHLLGIRKWQAAGLSLERIRELLHTPDASGLVPQPRKPGSVEVWSHLVVSDGVEVTLEPRRAGLTPEQVRALFAAVRAAYVEITRKDPEEPA